MGAKPINFEIKVGIFVFLGILFMFVIVFSIGEFYILKPMYDIKVLFGFANGVAVGAPVRLAGVNVGEIKDISVYYDEKLQRTRVMIMAKVKNEARIEKDSAFKINTLGLLGEKYLEISPGTTSSGFLKSEDVVIGADPVPVEEITETMKELSDNAKSITASMRVILDRLQKGEGTVGKFLVDESVYNNIKDVADRLQRGEGTVGKLLTEDKVYNDLEAFVEDIKRHPWKLLIKGKEEPQENKTEPLEKEGRPARQDFKR